MGEKCAITPAAVAVRRTEQKLSLGFSPILFLFGKQAISLLLDFINSKYFTIYIK